MDKGIYTALSGGLAKTREMELIANNLANSTTPGFKRDTGTFNEYLTEMRRADTPGTVDREIRALTDPEARPTGDKSFVEMDGVYTDFRPGTLERTGRQLDLAIEGKGFFEVLTPGGVRYTRAGNFSIGVDGRLVNTNGYPILSKSSGGKQTGLQLIGVDKNPGDVVPVKTPTPEERFIRLGQGQIDISPEGLIRQNGVVMGQIQVEEFHETQWLEKVGNSFYRNTSPKNVKESATSKIHQGFIEASNVNAVAEMTRLIEATRSYESQLQAIKTYHDIDNRTVNDIAKER